MKDFADREAAYLAFLREKINLAKFTGFEVPLEEINPALKPHTRDTVRWMVKGGNRACFARFGLHKTATQLECMRLIANPALAATVSVTSCAMWSFVRGYLVRRWFEGILKGCVE